LNKNISPSTLINFSQLPLRAEPPVMVGEVAGEEEGALVVKDLKVVE
jgi:hypothetical protein